MEIDGERSRQFVVVKSWHVVLTLIGWLVMVVLAYASLKYQGQENERRISDMEQNHVKKEQFTEFKEDLVRRLTRIEDKLDREHATRQAH